MLIFDCQDVYIPVWEGFGGVLGWFVFWVVVDHACHFAPLGVGHYDRQNTYSLDVRTKDLVGWSLSVYKIEWIIVTGICIRVWGRW